MFKKAFIQILITAIFLWQDIGFCASELSLRPPLRFNRAMKDSATGSDRHSEEWEKDYYKLAEELLDVRTKELFYKVDAFYRDLNVQKQIQMIREIARRINSAPFVYKVYGIGFPFYGDVDIRKRIYPYLRMLGDGRTSINDFIALIIPDIDILLVHGYSEEGPWGLTDNMDPKLMDTFIGEVSLYRKQWEGIFNKLSQDFLVTGKRLGSEGLDPVEDFRNGNRLHIDIVPVPMYIWQNIPVFIMPDDLKYFRFLRDLLFTTEPLSKKDTDLSQDLPSQFRCNYILNILKSRPLSEDELLAKIVEAHPYRHLIELWTQTQENVGAKFRAGLELALAEGLVYKDTSERLNLTEQGAQFLQSILAKRQEILQEGFNPEEVELMIVPAARVPRTQI